MLCVSECKSGHVNLGMSINYGNMIVGSNRYYIDWGICLKVSVLHCLNIE